MTIPTKKIDFNQPMQPNIFDPLWLREIEFRNRIWIPPMCQYSAPKGAPTKWHMRHYSTLAISSGCVIVEATAISSDARVTPEDLVLNDKTNVHLFSHLAEAISENGSVPGIQLCHAGRKASRRSPWNGDRSLRKEEGGWPIYAPSPLKYGEHYEMPLEMSHSDIKKSIDLFVNSSILAQQAGFKLIEIHAGHGRLAHSFFSPISNKRNDHYGGGLDARCTYAIELARAIRKAINSKVILAFRLSCVDWLNEGITLMDTIYLAKKLKDEGVDLIDCTSGGIISNIEKSTSPGYQVPFSSEIKARVEIATAAVGEIFDFGLANSIIESGQADIVMMGRKSLIDPGFTTRCAAEKERWDCVPVQYKRALKRLLKPSKILISEL